MSPHDDLSLPGRTMLTSEGTVNRSTHLLFVNNKYRLLTPIEAERLQDFPDDWTAYKKLEDGTVVEVSDKMRMFLWEMHWSPISLEKLVILSKP